MKLELDGLTKEFGDFTAVNHINLTMTNENVVYPFKANKRNDML